MWNNIHWIIIFEIMGAPLVWGRLGTLLLQEGVDPKVSELFYRAVTQSVLFFGSDIWVLLETIERKLVVTPMGFLRQIAGKQS